MNHTVVVLAEKPDVAKKIAGALGGIKDGASFIPFSKITSSTTKINELMKAGYLETVFNGSPCYVTWAQGHLCRLKDAADYNSGFKNWKIMPKPFIPAKYSIKPIDINSNTRLKAIDGLKHLSKVSENRIAIIMSDSSLQDKNPSVVFADTKRIFVGGNGKLLLNMNRKQRYE